MREQGRGRPWWRGRPPASRSSCAAAMRISSASGHTKECTRVPVPITQAKLLSASLVLGSETAMEPGVLLASFFFPSCFRPRVFFFFAHPDPPCPPQPTQTTQPTPFCLQRASFFCSFLALRALFFFRAFPSLLALALAFAIFSPGVPIPLLLLLFSPHTRSTYCVGT